MTLRRSVLWWPLYHRLKILLSSVLQDALQHQSFVNCNCACHLLIHTASEPQPCISICGVLLGKWVKHIEDYFYLYIPSVLWCCWLGSKKGIRPVKTECWGAGVVICLEWGADLHMAQLVPLPLTVSYFSEIQIGFTFLIFPEKGPLNGLCIYTFLLNTWISQTSRPSLTGDGWNDVDLLDAVSLILLPIKGVIFLKTPILGHK